MSQVILIYANCYNATASGDFAFAGNIAKDVVRELKKVNSSIDVILVSTLDGVPRFEKIYGTAVSGRVRVDGEDIGLCSLELFDAIEHDVVAFIEANRCKYAPAEVVKRVLSPDSKFLFVLNVNQAEIDVIQDLLEDRIKEKQPVLYDCLNPENTFYGSAGLGGNRLGLPTIPKVADLSPLDNSLSSKIPSGQFGFMYLAANSQKDYPLIAQYIKLTGVGQYHLVGDFSRQKDKIKVAYETDNTLNAPQKDLPNIEYHQSVPNALMRRMVAHATPLVLSTGTTSTLEALQDGKLIYYQDLDNNQQFVASYLIAVKSIVLSDSSFVGCMSEIIIELTGLLFAPKPLSRKDMGRVQELISIDALHVKVADVNQTILAQANGKIAPKLLSFIGGAKNTQAHMQLNQVCASLRKEGETGSPIHTQALRRAAAWGRLFELKVIIKSISPQDLDSRDPQNRSALHWAVLGKHFDCARKLIAVGAPVNGQDKAGKTPLHYAVKGGDKLMIEALIKAGASTDVVDNDAKRPEECALELGITLFVLMQIAELSNACYSSYEYSSLD